MNPTAEQLRAAGWVEKSPGQWVKDSLIQENGIWTVRSRYSVQELKATIKERGIEALVAAGWKRADLENLGAGGGREQQDTAEVPADTRLAMPQLATGEADRCRSTRPARTVKRLRQSSKPVLNKLENEFFATIKDKHKYYGPVRPHAKTYRLANGVRYTPDFSASLWPSPPGQAPRETAWEVKGKHAWDDSLVKVKVAASSWPEVRWILVWKQDGQWQEQEILP